MRHGVTPAPAPHWGGARVSATWPPPARVCPAMTCSSQSARYLAYYRSITVPLMPCPQIYWRGREIQHDLPEPDWEILRRPPAPETGPGHSVWVSLCLEVAHQVLHRPEIPRTGAGAGGAAPAVQVLLSNQWGEERLWWEAGQLPEHHPQYLHKPERFLLKDGLCNCLGQNSEGEWALIAHPSSESNKWFYFRVWDLVLWASCRSPGASSVRALTRRAWAGPWPGPGTSPQTTPWRPSDRWSSPTPS